MSDLQYLENRYNELMKQYVDVEEAAASEQAACQDRIDMLGAEIYAIQEELNEEVEENSVLKTLDNIYSGGVDSAKKKLENIEDRIIELEGEIGVQKVRMEDLASEPEDESSGELKKLESKYYNFLSAVFHDVDRSYEKWEDLLYEDEMDATKQEIADLRAKLRALINKDMKLKNVLQDADITALERDIVENTHKADLAYSVDQIFKMRCTVWKTFVKRMKPAAFQKNMKALQGAFVKIGEEQKSLSQSTLKLEQTKVICDEQTLYHDEKDMELKEEMLKLRNMEIMLAESIKFMNVLKDDWGIVGEMDVEKPTYAKKDYDFLTPDEIFGEAGKAIEAQYEQARAEMAIKRAKAAEMKKAREAAAAGRGQSMLTDPTDAQMAVAMCG